VTVQKKDGYIAVQFCKKPCEPILMHMRGMCVWCGKSWSVEFRSTLRYPLEQLFKMLFDRSWSVGSAQS